MLDDTARADLTRLAKSLDNKTAAVMLVMLMAGKASVQFSFADEMEASAWALRSVGIDPDILDQADALEMAGDIVDAFDPSGPRQPLAPRRADQKSPLTLAVEEAARFAVEQYVLAAGVHRADPSDDNARALEAVVNRMWWAESALRLMRDLEPA